MRFTIPDPQPQPSFWAVAICDLIGITAFAIFSVLVSDALGWLR